jgi:ABC-type uncharacterized transport system substrate-binding protein
LVPAATRISVFAYARSPRNVPRITAIEALARPLGLQVAARLVSDLPEFEGAFAASAADHDQAMLVQASPVAAENAETIIALAAKYRRRLSTIFGYLLTTAVCCSTARSGERISNAPPCSSTRS